ncbi:SDR family NAD(P)-dependent oxidoreductase [Paraliomyxa miuraensis]|uniref:SDR family NAD(P)-dependent oxidoreductase n=1 Tax=Paraliomyxa miuraensis TaxID=376150 RepID=UPI00225AEBB7|nr:SDR family NAD(P)-dependent oxidoreductase [Paraliomyxa miuraensis]MCX4245267.1 SDR family NAD(P)-dependent oxidoreductase [Paraliomyxa miuraensis]
MSSAQSQDQFRTALVTGASSGIGAALAKQLAAQGIEVALLARRREALQELADAIEQAGGRASIHPVDVSDPEATVAAVRAVDDAVGGLDLVVANAGVGTTQWSGKLGWDDCAQVLAVNVAGATATLVAVLPRMVKRKRGHLVGISSIAGYRGLPRLAVYSGSKAYLSTFLEGLRIDLRGTGVTVTDVRPGYVETAMTAGNGKMPFLVTAEDAAQRICKAIAARRRVLAFPLPMAAAGRTMAALPNVLYDRMMKGGR